MSVRDLVPLAKNALDLNRDESASKTNKSDVVAADSQDADAAR